MTPPSPTTPAAFDYALPPDQIAQVPTPSRADARMLVLHADTPCETTTVAALPDHLPADALVVVNASRVVPARVHARRPDGRTFELLVCDPAAVPTRGGSLRAWVRGAKRLRPGDRLAIGELELVYREPDATDPRARWFDVTAGELLAVLQEHGDVPLPPYIERPTTPADRDRYQTVYATARGSVAAPTAGLHIDEDMVAHLDPVRITLHVGPGTFLPMDVDDVRDHRVGAERIDIDAAAAARIEAARRDRRPIVAVGTTVTRALEAVAADNAGRIVPTEATTDLVITPGYRFAVVDRLLTNFHLPRSSLLMLVCSFGGHDRVLSAYRHAVQAGFRFYSYGDCMLVDRGEPPDARSR